MVDRRTLLKMAGAAAAMPALSRMAFAQGTGKSVLKLIPQTGLTTLDPIWTTATVTAAHGFYVFDQLYGMDSKLAPQPQMAESAVEADDKLSWTVTLRKGLLFHDGSPVRPEDCIASLKRWGVRDTLGQNLLNAVSDWSVVGERKFKVVLKNPFPLLIALGKPATNVPFIMPERLANTDPGTQITEMVGSGPYKFIASEFNSGNFVAYEKFQEYVPREEPADLTAGGKVAHFERVEWQTISDAATAFAALTNGEVDWWENVLADFVPSLRTNPDITLGSGDPNGYVGLLRFNCSMPPFNNRELRLAIASAVRQVDYMEAVTGNDKEIYRLCTSFIPCGTPYAHEPKNNLITENPNLEAAAAAVKAAGYNGERIVIINPTDQPAIQPLGQITAETLRRIGFNVDLQEMDWGSLVGRRANRESIDNGGWNIFHTWWQGIGITTPPTAGLIRGQGEGGWFGWYENAEIEKLTAEWLLASTEEERVRLAQEVQEVAATEYPSVPLGVFQIRSAYRANLKGVVPGVSAFPWNVDRT